MSHESGSFMSGLRELLTRFDDDGIVLTIRSVATRRKGDVQLDICFGVDTCGLCGFHPSDPRAGKCPQCKGRLPSKRYPWRVKVEGPPAVIERVLGDRDRPFNTDVGLGAQSTARCKVTDPDAALAAWVFARNRLRLDVADLHNAYRTAAPSSDVARRFESLGFAYEPQV